MIRIQSPVKHRMALSACALLCLLLTGCREQSPVSPDGGEMVLEAAPDDDCNVQLSWSAWSGGSFLEYRLHRRTDAGNPEGGCRSNVPILSAPEDWVTSYVDDEVLPGMTYTYRLEVALEPGRSVWSEEVEVVVPEEILALPTVTGLFIDVGNTAGDSVSMMWDPIVGTEIDGYIVYFMPCAEGDWQVIDTVTTEACTDHATCAGNYSVKAYFGSELSEDYAAPVSDMPNIIAEWYTIYDQFAPADYHSGFIFGMTGGQTGYASDPGFVQDMYCYDYTKGDPDAGLSSGDYGPYGNGNEMWFYAAEGVYGYCPECDGSSGWWDHGMLYPADDVIFGYLYDGYYVKIYIIDIFPEPISMNGTGVVLTYEIQPINELRLFTEESTSGI